MGDANAADLPKILEEEAALHHEADVLRERLTVVEARLAAAQARKAIYAPVYRLPVELLSAIFKIGHFEHGELFKAGNYWKFKFRGTICLVSRRFRDVAIGTPALWTYISLRLGHVHRSFSHPAHNVSPVSYLEYCTKRSAELPLSIYTTFRCHCQEDVYFDALIMDRLAFYTSRLKRLHIQTETTADGVVLLLQRFRSASAPLLEYFRIEGQEDAEFLDESPIFTGGTPRLSYLDFTTNVVLPPSRGPFPPLRTVTTLSIRGVDDMDYAHIRHLLHAMPSLTTLKLSMTFLMHENNTFPPIILPQLKTIVIKGEGGDWIAPYLMAPNLETLQIRAMSSGCPCIIELLGVHGKYASLRTLEVKETSWTVPPEDFNEAFLRSMPLLESVTFFLDFDTTDTILQTLTNPERTGDGQIEPDVIWPHLHGLYIKKATPSVIRLFLRYRAIRNCPIKELGLHYVTTSFRSKPTSRFKWIEEEMCDCEECEPESSDEDSDGLDWQSSDSSELSFI
ncbi:hypothetical protein JAAARDRAFT_208281 [Jaapia argillacea MUCL 33604]|uniref:Uncharacterized protein n=1 Tax=Jaapia argillacea MUCL 33604 TaxID=933084 RepID=A0A067PML3_9AGAM|nr:hypothetical protein JAAARDRAFT_208281 [Jaapia argillacea MUCL 33604]